MHANQCLFLILSARAPYARGAPTAPPSTRAPAHGSPCPSPARRCHLTPLARAPASARDASRSAWCGRAARGRVWGWADRQLIASDNSPLARVRAGAGGRVCARGMAFGVGDTRGTGKFFEIFARCARRQILNQILKNPDPGQQTETPLTTLSVTSLRATRYEPGVGLSENESR